MMNPQTKKELKQYREANMRLYGCWCCKVTLGTLFSVDKNLYACSQHMAVRVPR